MQNRPLNLVMISVLLGLAAIRGINFTAIKVSLSGLTPFVSAGLRNTIAASALIGYALLARRSWWPPPEYRLRLLGMGALFTFNFLIVYSGMHYTTASRASILLNAQPLAVAWLARYFVPSDRISSRQMLGLFLAFSGVVLVVSDRASSLQFTTLRGDLMMLLAAFNWAILVILRKKVAQKVDPSVVAGWEVLVGAGVTLPLGWWLDGPESVHWSLAVGLAILYSGLIGGALVFGANVYLIKHYDVNAVSSFNFMIPVVGTFVGIGVLQEPFSPQIGLGALLVALGIYVVNR